VAPVAGLVTDTVGAGLTTFTTTAALVAERSESVDAVAVRECCPERPVACHWTEIVHVG
jgi:hypothetical protein